ncbi:hypothetical protein RM543_13120 [Roseicyclus sp. F158]|uniref:Uncharacterized protein n=1 Tax=Tropicimonas omnivorans TaxID=3075590 RepID=A0ABU3DIT2_9RHOB|nr:hypothetical protein [Roseicyclus sp. F158]MDT0683630.1 hypothetical protein [Roseicyclus sp. F158]
MAEDEQIMPLGNGAFALRLDGLDNRYRAIVPADFLDDELGEAATDGERVLWIRDNLAHILGAVTARETGGTVREPWGRVFVEETGEGYA